MTKYSGLLLSEAGLLFIVIFVLLYLIFKKDKEEGYIKKRSGLYSNFSPKTIVYIVLAAVAITYFVSQFSNSGFTTALCFVAILGMAPLLLNNAAKRDKQEQTFADVILYCQNMGMLLKQTHNVYSSIKIAKEDLETTLSEDLTGLLYALENGREQAMEAMSVLESNYPYSCIRNLDVIILHMYFENAKVDDSLLTTYQDDVTRLEQDVRQNKSKRKSLRLAYMGITIGSVLSYYFFNNSLAKNFPEIFNNDTYRIVNMVYIFATMFAFFFVDRYFNLNTTRE